MPHLLVTDRNGADFPIEAGEGSTVMELIRDAGFQDGFALCGGNCSCATCHVYVDDAAFARLPAMSAEEDELLESSPNRRQNSRLSCQVPFGEALAGARVTVAPED